MRPGLSADRLRQGDIGRVVSARGRYGWAGPDWADWFYQPGGGSLFDLGVYNLTTFTGWLGPVRRVAAMTGIAIPQRNVRGRTLRVEADDNAQVQVVSGLGPLPVIGFLCLSKNFRSGGRSRRGFWLAFSSGVIASVGNVAYYRALAAGGKASVVTPMASLYSLVTMPLAVTLLGERLSGREALGIRWPWRPWWR